MWYWYTHRTTRQTEHGEVPGVFLPAIIHNIHHYLTMLAVYADGMVDCWGLITFDEFVDQVRSGWVANEVPPGQTLGIHHLVDVTVTASEPAGTMDDLIKDVRNAIEELNGRPTAQEKIIDAIKAFKSCDTPQAREAFLASYEALPSYYRKYVFGSRMEKHKDIQKLLNPDQSPNAAVDLSGGF